VVVRKEDAAFIALFERTGEFSPGDREYEAYRNFNLGAVDRGRRIAARLAELTNVQGAQVLDVGCGSGGLSIAFAERGATVQAVEPDPTRLAWAQARVEGYGVPVAVESGAAESLQFADGSFEIVLLDSVIEHVDDPDATLAEVARVLRPGGLLYITWPSKWSLALILRDPHYQLFGVVLMPRWLGRFYVERVRKVKRGYWVNRIPSRRWLARRLAERGITLRMLEPEGLDKLRNPDAMSGHHPWVRRAAQLANKIGAERVLVRLAVAQYAGPSALGFKRG
jgi:ubiquinone/menaquinone biosynthesis C-methylase UbiE